jgi:hypothetical protein
MDIADDIFRDRFRVFLEDVADGFYETDLKGLFPVFQQCHCAAYSATRPTEIQGAQLP